ncbi:MAG: orotidine-5'-phosphate decarboxylase [Acidobacteriota bacterium]|nr:orotidine-5'-phosphate decarboxylase [Acidobacteriota bacterium]
MSRTDAARGRLAVALDLPDGAQILAMARRVAPEAGFLKLGLEAFVAEGPSLVREIARSRAGVFLDLKLHDIPNTVGRSAAAAVRTGATIVNCHAAGGAEMMKAFGEDGRAAAAKAGLPAPRLIAVTILTSLDAAAVHAVGLTGSPREAALRLAVLAQSAGLDGVVCSAEEITAIRAACGRDFLLVVPGVRPTGAASGDQKRVATPGEAIRAGADVLVVGRPITGAPDPAVAARAIVAEIAAAFPPPDIGLTPP